jgi:hypothetical protein
MNSRCRILKSQPKTIATSQKQTEFTSSTWICCHNTDQGFEFVRHLAIKKGGGFRTLSKYSFLMKRERQITGIQIKVNMLRCSRGVR